MKKTIGSVLQAFPYRYKASSGDHFFQIVTVINVIKIEIILFYDYFSRYEYLLCAFSIVMIFSIFTSISSCSII
jgi:hypothetical protein